MYIRSIYSIHAITIPASTNGAIVVVSAPLGPSKPNASLFLPQKKLVSLTIYYSFCIFDVNTYPKNSMSSIPLMQYGTITLQPPT